MFPFTDELVNEWFERTFDEDVAGSRTRQSAGAVFISYDETGSTFDTSSLKFDNG